MSRPAVVAGTFYPCDAEALRNELEELWPQPAPEAAPYLAVMAPHAGYVYSGRTAAQVYARLAPADTYVLIGPNHTGLGSAISVASDVPWTTPLGTVPVDVELSRIIMDLCPEAWTDDAAHRREHALEVQLPFLQRLSSSFSIVAITLGTFRMSILQQFGEALAEAIRRRSSRTVIVASSDMSHFENLNRTRQLDTLALEQIQALNPQGLIDVVTREDISMCGAAPAAAMLVAALGLGATQADIIDYATSADVSGDEDRVVGYAGVVVR